MEHHAPDDLGKGQSTFSLALFPVPCFYPLLLPLYYESISSFLFMILSLSFLLSKSLFNPWMYLVPTSFHPFLSSEASFVFLSPDSVHFRFLYSCPIPTPHTLSPLLSSKCKSTITSQSPLLSFTSSLVTNSVTISLSQLSVVFCFSVQFTSVSQSSTSTYEASRWRKEIEG